MTEGATDGTDASGNPILKDIGPFLKSAIKAVHKEGDIKYIDPTCARKPSSCAAIAVFHASW